jgi:hypothetical protein
MKIGTFDAESGFGVKHCTQSLINIGPLHGNLNVKDLLSHPTNIYGNTHKKTDNIK